jgi:hypothetical protein
MKENLGVKHNRIQDKQVNRVMFDNEMYNMLHMYRS